MKKTHVLVVARHLVGGIRSYLKYVYGCLEPSRYRLTIVAPASGEHELLRPSLAGFDTSWVIVPDRHMAFELGRAVRGTLASQDVDIVHAQGTTAAVASVVALLGRDTPHLATLHETFYPSQFEGAAGAIKRGVLALTLRRVDTLNLVSHDAMRNLLEELPLMRSAARRLLVIEHGVDVNEFSDVARARARRPLTDETVFGFLGRFMPEKGFGELIDAVARLSVRRPHARFHVLAASDGSFVREYRAEIGRRGLERYFRFSGLVPSPDAVLRSADAIVMPSLREASGLVAMEAMSAGCPLIASDCIGLREVTDATPTLRVRAGDSSSLAEAMAEVMQRRESLVGQALEFVATAASRFDAHRSAQALEQAFEHLLRNRRR